MDNEQRQQLEKHGITFKSTPLEGDSKKIYEWSFSDYEIVTIWWKDGKEKLGYYSTVRKNGKYFKGVFVGKVSICDAVIKTVFGVVSGLEQQIQFKDRHIELLNKYIDKMECEK